MPFDPFGKLAAAQRWRENQNLREQQAQVNNALARSRTNLIDIQVQQARQKQRFNAIKQQINMVGPYAKQILENPESYQRVNQQMRDLFPETANVPDGTFEEDKPYLETMSRLYDRLNPSEDYTLGPGEVRFSGGEEIARGPQGREKTGGPMVTLVNPGDLSDKRTVRRDSGRADKLLEQGYIESSAAPKTPGSVETKRKIDIAQKAISSILDKYGIDKSPYAFLNTLETNPDGTYKAPSEEDKQAFMETAYSVVARKADAGDKQAQKDLRQVDYYLDRITKLAGRPPEKPSELPQAKSFERPQEQSFGQLSSQESLYQPRPTGNPQKSSEWSSLQTPLYQMHSTGTSQKSSTNDPLELFK